MDKKEPTLTERYETAYFLLLNSEDKEMQSRIKAAKENPDKKDDRVQAFIRRVVDAAEKGII